MYEVFAPHVHVSIAYLFSWIAIFFTPIAAHVLLSNLANRVQAALRRREMWKQLNAISGRSMRERARV